VHVEMALLAARSLGGDEEHPRAATTARATSIRMRGPACQPAWGRPTLFRLVHARRVT
jgi:hypothetical protein